MTAFVACPNCEQSTDPQARFCVHCGADLALAAVLAESRVQVPMPLPEGAMMTPEILVPRLGDYLLEKGFISQLDLDLALKYQKNKQENGETVLLGRVLQELELIDHEKLDQVITEQILELQSALKQSNMQLEQRVNERTKDLQNALEKLTELNQLKANFISNISHELRTPLAHIKGYMDIFIEGGFGALSSQQIDAMEVLRRAEARLERLIEDLIQFSLASRGELALKIANVNFEELIAKAVHEASNKAMSKNIHLISDNEHQNLMVRCDGEKIFWVVSQILDNAIKFTPKGGKVEVMTNRDVDLASLIIRDTGIGIPADRFEEIFMPFHQLDGSTTRRFGGTGLGLALCNQIIEAHGSTIHVASEVDRGSEFKFSLPIVRQDDA